MRKPPGLPIRITLCILLVLTNSAWNFVRLLTSITWFQVLEFYAPQPSPVYIGMTGAIWATGGFLVAWGLLRRSQWALRGLLIGAWLYAAWTWLDRVLLQAGGPPNWGFTLVTNIVLLGFITAVALDRRINILFRKEAHEREPQDPSSA